MAAMNKISQPDSEKNGEFKCCKKKTNTMYFVCIKCYCLLHKSCFLRLKNNLIIDGHKVICNDCKQKPETLDETENYYIYKEMIEELQNENVYLNNHLNKLKKERQLYNDEVLETEMKLNNVIDNQQKTIEELI